MSNKVYVVGVGMTKFEKPGSREGWDYPDMARESGTKALADAGVGDIVLGPYRLVNLMLGLCYGLAWFGLNRVEHHMRRHGGPDAQLQARRRVSLAPPTQKPADRRALFLARAMVHAARRRRIAVPARMIAPSNAA